MKNIIAGIVSVVMMVLSFIAIFYFLYFALAQGRELDEEKESCSYYKNIVLADVPAYCLKHFKKF